MKLLLLLLLLIFQLTITTSAENASSASEFKPVEPTEYRLIEASIIANDSARRRILAPFQLCLLCKCCGAPAASCSTMPCCFGIDCHLPNKPYGVCAFVPKTCNCTSCAV